MSSEGWVKQLGMFIYKGRKRKGREGGGSKERKKDEKEGRLEVKKSRKKQKGGSGME